MPDSPHPPPVIGFAHRGARAHARENTIEAFTLACGMGATGLETDVWLSRDGQVVIDHDGVVRSGWRRRPIRSFLAEDLPEHLPTLEELQLHVPAETKLSIDVKDPGAAAGIVATRARAGVSALANTWLCDTDPERLASWRALDSHVHLVASIRKRRLVRWPFQRLAAAGIEVVNLPHRQWTPSRIRSCHEAGLDAFAWGVQNPTRMRTLIDWGIDAIFSDHTDRMVRVIEATTNRSG